MVENVLVLKNCSVKTKITAKSLISVALVALAVALPQIIHLAAGFAGGVQWLPMYLPILIGGCLLGAWWGLAVGIASPIISFVITSAVNNPMPALARLPFMVVELAVFAVVAGLFSKKIANNAWLAFPAVLLAQIAGRAVFMLLVLVFQSVTPFTPALIWKQIQTGLLGMVLQAVTVPFIVMGLKLILNKENKKQ